MADSAVDEAKREKEALGGDDVLDLLRNAIDPVEAHEGDGAAMTLRAALWTFRDSCRKVWGTMQAAAALYAHAVEDQRCELATITQAASDLARKIREEVDQRALSPAHARRGQITDWPAYTWTHVLDRRRAFEHGLRGRELAIERMRGLVALEYERGNQERLALWRSFVTTLRERGSALRPAQWSVLQLHEGMQREATALWGSGRAQRVWEIEAPPEYAKAILVTAYMQNVVVPYAQETHRRITNTGDLQPAIPAPTN